jgi:hypothetical protein
LPIDYLVELRGIAWNCMAFGGKSEDPAKLSQNCETFAVVRIQTWRLTGLAGKVASPCSVV